MTHPNLFLLRNIHLPSVLLKNPLLLLRIPPRWWYAGENWSQTKQKNVQGHLLWVAQIKYLSVWYFVLKLFERISIWLISIWVIENSPSVASFTVHVFSWLSYMEVDLLSTFKPLLIFRSFCSPSKAPEDTESAPEDTVNSSLDLKFTPHHIETRQSVYVGVLLLFCYYPI